MPHSVPCRMGYAAVRNAVARRPLRRSGADLADPRESPAERAVELHTHAEVADLDLAAQVDLQHVQLRGGLTKLLNGMCCAATW